MVPYRNSGRTPHRPVTVSTHASAPAYRPSRRRPLASRASRYALNASSSASARNSPAQIRPTHSAANASKIARYTRQIYDSRFTIVEFVLNLNRESRIVNRECVSPSGPEASGTPGSRRRLRSGSRPRSRGPTHRRTSTRRLAFRHAPSGQCGGCTPRRSAARRS